MADLNALLVFAAVGKAGSFSAAARRLGMPVSTVSRRVAGLEDQLGLRLIERSTRSLRLTEVGSAVLEHASRGLEISEAVDLLAADRASAVSGLLRLSAPPGVAEALLVPIAGALQADYPDIRLQILAPGHADDPEGAGADLMFRFGALRDSALIATKLLSYRHQLVASPGYLARRRPPARPQDLAEHRLLTSLDRTADKRWSFVRADGGGRDVLQFRPHLAMSDHAGLIAAALADGGICDLPPVVRPDLLRDGRLVEVMPDWRFETFDLSLVHPGRHHVPRPVRLFKQVAARMAPCLFPHLPR